MYHNFWHQMHKQIQNSPASKRWLELCSDPGLADRPERFEIDANGQLIISPPPGYHHRQKSIDIAILLRLAQPGRLAIVEQAILTADGQVRIADVALLSPQQQRWLDENPSLPLPQAPPVCVEILSPSNSTAEIKQKRALYFAAGAQEVWICHQNGLLRFFDPKGEISNSLLLPRFPQYIQTEQGVENKLAPNRTPTRLPDSPDPTAPPSQLPEPPEPPSL
jgi:Uma2 family endonuclease